MFFDRLAEKSGAKRIKTFAAQMYRELGMRMVILTAHTDTEGRIALAV